MANLRLDRFTKIHVAAVIAVVFGLLTIKSGGSVLFIDGAFREGVGNYVPFVVWFNFLAGFLYLIAAVGLWMQKYWSVWVSFVIAGSTCITFFLLGIYILNDGMYEVRTIVAMSFRVLVWLAIATLAYCKLVLETRSICISPSLNIDE